jgi:hypothetical protein
MQLLTASDGIDMNALHTDPQSETLMEQPIWQSATQINAHHAINAYMPQIVMDDHGNAMAVWTQTDGQRSSTWTNRFQVGQGWDTTMPLATNHGRPTDAPHIAINAQGAAIAVWAQDDVHGSSVWARHYSTATGWSRPELLETGQVQNPKIAINAQGLAIAIWQQVEGMHYSLWSSRYVAGSGWSPHELIQISHHGAANRLQIAMHTNGNAVAVWYQFDGKFYRIWAKHYTVDAGWCATQRLIDNWGNAFSPQVCMQADGKVLAAWYQDDGQHNGIWASECSANRSWHAPERIGAHNDGDALDPQIASTSQGRTHSVWSQSNGKDGLIWTNRHVPGAGWGMPELIQADRTGIAGCPQIAANAHGKACAVWVQSDGRRDHLVAGHYTPQHGWARPQRLHIDHMGDALMPQLAINASGHAMAVWQQYDGMGSCILAASYSAINHSVLAMKEIAA